MGLMKKLTSAVVASSLVLSAAGTVLAAPSADEQSASFARMEALKLVVGTDQGPELDGPLTRAQLLTIIVRAFQQETAANLLKDLGSFSDVPGGQWYSGYVAVAKNLATERGFAIGYPDGTFQPNKQVSVIEALAMIMKFLGVPTGTGDNWIAQTIENAKAYGVITDADVENYFADPNAPATRGVAIALADQIFSTYKVAGTDKTVYTYYVDTVAPTLNVTKPANPTTSDATYTVQGVVEAGADVYVNGEKVTVTNGTFAYEVALNAGTNTITVSAVDVAGNVTSDTITITRVAGEAAKIVAEPLEVQAGSETELPFKVVDANDLELADAAAAVQVTLSEGIGTYEDGIFKASEKAGKGTITLTLGDLTATMDVTIVPGPLHTVKAEVESVAPSERVKLIAVDEFGNAIEGAQFSEDSPNAVIEGDEFFASKPGVYEVTATVGETSVTGKILVYGPVDDLKIEAPADMVQNGKTEYEVKVVAVDENGATVRNFDEYIRLESADIDFSKTAKAKDGVATFKITIPEGVDEVELTAYLVDDPDVEETITVETAEQKATAIKLETSAFLGIGPRALPFEGKVFILDQAGEKMLDVDEEVTLKVSSPGYFLVDGEEEREIELDVDEEGATFTLSDDLDEDTVLTITATAEGLKEATAEVKAVYATKATRLVLTKVDTATASKAYYRIGLTDRNGVPVKADADTDIDLTFSVAKDVKYAVANDLDTLKNKATVDVPSSKTVEKAVSIDEDEAYAYVAVEITKAQNVNLKVSAKGLTSANVDVAFAAAKIQALTIKDGIEGDEENEFYFLVEPDKATDVEIQLTDENGFPAKGVRKLEIASANKDLRINGKQKVELYTDENGKATVKVTLPWYAGLDGMIIDADIDGDGVTEETYVVWVEEAGSIARDVRVTAYLYEDGTLTKKVTDFLYSDSIALVVEVREGNRWVKAGRSERLDWTFELNGEEIDELVSDGWASGDFYVLPDLSDKNEDGVYNVTVKVVNAIGQPSASLEFHVHGGAAEQVKVSPETVDVKKAGDWSEEVTVTLLGKNPDYFAKKADFWFAVEVAAKDKNYTTVKVGGKEYKAGELIKVSKDNQVKFTVKSPATEITVKVYSDSKAEKQIGSVQTVTLRQPEE